MDSLKALIGKLQEWTKDPVKLAFGLIVLFFISIIYSIIKMITLRSNLIYKGGMTSVALEGGVLAGFFIAIGITFIIGIAAIYVNQKVKKEMVVFIEKKEEQKSSDENKSSDEGYFDFKSFQEAISKPGTVQEKQQQGLNLICKYLEAGQGAFYEWDGSEAKFTKGFAFVPEFEITPYKLGEGLVGQAATGRSIYLDELPEDYVNTIESGLGMAKPKSLLLLPLLKDSNVKGVIEVATFKLLSPNVRKNAQEAAKILADNC